MKNEFKLKVKEFKRGLIKELLGQCTDEQKSFFNRLYGSINAITEDKMHNAYYQCKRTIKTNKEKVNV